jgi:hypothetical protein
MCGRTPGDAGLCCSRDVPAVMLAAAMTKDLSLWSGPVGRFHLLAGLLAFASHWLHNGFT